MKTMTCQIQMMEKPTESLRADRKTFADKNLSCESRATVFLLAVRPNEIPFARAVKKGAPAIRLDALPDLPWQGFGRRPLVRHNCDHASQHHSIRPSHPPLLCEGSKQNGEQIFAFVNS